MKHWPWQHKYTAIASQQVLTDYLGTGDRLKEGVGTHETIVLFRCECGKIKTRKISGHWNGEALALAFGNPAAEEHPNAK